MMRNILVRLALSVVSALAAMHASLAGADDAADWRFYKTDGIAAIVNDRIVTLAEVQREVGGIEDRLRQQREEGRFTSEELVKRILAERSNGLQRLIDRLLILEEARTLGVTAPPEAVNQLEDQVVSKSYGGDRYFFERSIHREGLTMAELREELKCDVVIEVMRQKMVTEKTTDTEKQRSLTRAWMKRLRAGAFVKTW